MKRRKREERENKSGRATIDGLVIIDAALTELDSWEQIFGIELTSQPCQLGNLIVVSERRS